jgi:periplasmic divalent cation tolerance protein
MSDHCVVTCAAGTVDEARALAGALLDRRLAACVQLIPVESHYVWQGERVDDAETLLLVKTRTELYPALEAAVAELHSYEVPELLRLDVAGGLPAYLRWIDEVTAG